MFKQIVIAGAAGAALLGGGAIALAADSPSPSGAPASSASSASSAAGTSSAPAAGRAGKRADTVRQVLNRLKDFDHGEWVTGPSGSSVTHEAAKGTVSAVSATSIQVHSADGSTTTFTVDSATKVGLREGGKGSAKKGTIADVKAGDTVLVAGTKTGTTTTANTIADAGVK